MFKINYTRESLSHQLNTYYNGVSGPNPSKFYLIVCKFYTGTINNVSTIDGSLNLVDHTLEVGDTVRLSPSEGGVLPTPFVVNRIYHVVSLSSNTIRLSTSNGGSPIIPTNTGVGSITVLEVADSDTSINKWVSKEIEVDGYSRLNFNPGSAVYNSTNASKLPEVSLSFLPNVDTSLNYIALLRDAESTIKNTLGGVVWYVYLGDKIVEAYGRLNIPLNVFIKSE